MSALSRKQVIVLAKLARQAWDAMPEGDREAFLDANPELSVSACFTAWRHWQTGLACGVQSLRAATQEDYLKIRARFLHLAGRDAEAMGDLVRDQEHGRIVAWQKLHKALAERGLAQGYAEAICRRQYKCALGEATEKQLWRLLYTVRNRRKAQRPAAGPQYVQAECGTLKSG